MRRVAIALLVLLSASAPAGARKDPRHMTTATPFTITLTLTHGDLLRATIHNVSHHAQPLLPDDDRQPSALVVADAGGAVAVPFDERKRRKYDRSIAREDFEPLAAGESRVLREGVLAHGAGGATLHWGPYTYAGLRAGTYHVRVAWTSAVETWHDEADGGEGAVPGVWKGTVRSNVVDLHVR